MSKKDSIKFDLVSSFAPKGDQPAAIKKLTDGVLANKDFQVLLGVTGSGKTFTMANIIKNVQRPTLILAHNKTLVAQLYEEFRSFFPNNAVEYFVSYYDYYQPEAYVESTDTYIEKDSQINDTIDRMRHRATMSLLTRKDVIIVSSVSCIYGIGSSETYQNMTCHIELWQKIKRDSFLRQLIESQYQRNDVEFQRGVFKVKGDIVEVFPPHEEDVAIRIEFFGDEIEKITSFDALTKNKIKDFDSYTFFPSSHYATSKELLQKATTSIREELLQELVKLKAENSLLKAERLENRTLADLEMLETMGTCKGIENYSRHLSGRHEGDAPPTLLDYFPKDFLLFIDESHQTLPQVRAMYKGDRSRKDNLVRNGFRLPSALDNRPLMFDEFLSHLKTTIFVSATPSAFELSKTHGEVVEQLVRPTGLLDPVVLIKPVSNQIDDAIFECKKTVAANERVLITTLTKKMAEDISDYLSDAGLKVKYLHSDIDTLERSEILRNLRLGTFDILVGINLLREGLDLPEVALVLILDADKEGFLRSKTGLIQTIGRAARNTNGKAILYADKMTDSINETMLETSRRRAIQEKYNKKHGITPTSTNRSISILEQGFIKKEEDQKGQKTFTNTKEIEREIKSLKGKMRILAQNMEFEKAANIRDEIAKLKALLITI